MFKQGKRVLAAVLSAAVLMTVTALPIAAETKKPEAGKATAAKKAQPVEMVAMVNGVAIARLDFDREVLSMRNRLAMHGGMDAQRESELQKTVLEKMIGGELLYQASKKKGVKVEAAAVDAELANLKKRFADDKEFKEAIGRAKVTEAELKNQMRRNLAIQGLIEQNFASKATVTPEEAKTFYEKNKEGFTQPEQVQASHILIEVKPDAAKAEKDAARKKIEAIQKKVKAGEDFAKLAEENSQCPSSTRGGDLGYFSRGQMVPAFETAAFGLKPGAVSEIVETEFGYHLIKLVDKKEASTVPFEAAREQINQRLKAGKVQEALGAYVVELEKGAKIERLLAEAK